MLRQRDERRTRELIQALLATLQSIHIELHSFVRLLNPIEKNNRGVTDSGQPTECSDSELPTGAFVRAKTEFPGTLVKEYRANQKTSATLQKRSFWIGVFTLVAVVVYAGITYEQWRTMDETLASTQRAYLTAGQPEKWSGHDRIALPIENYGHVPSANPTFNLRYEIWLKKNGADVRVADIAHVEKSATVIGPGPAGYRVVITVPPLSAIELKAVKADLLSEIIMGFVEYDTGFHYRDNFQFCVTYNRPSDGWINCGHQTEYIDMQKVQPK